MVKNPEKRKELGASQGVRRRMAGKQRATVE